MLVKQELSSKASSPYEGNPMEVQYRKVTQVVARRRDGGNVTRSTAYLTTTGYSRKGRKFR